MKVHELIVLLQTMPQDLEVYNYCDHGQSPEKTAHPSIAYTKETLNALWDDWCQGQVDAYEEGYATKFVLL